LADTLTQDFQDMRILSVKQRIQTIVVYERLVEDKDAEEREMIVDSYDRPLQAAYQ
jgi:hypothetical protein